MERSAYAHHTTFRQGISKTGELIVRRVDEDPRSGNRRRRPTRRTPTPSRARLAAVHTAARSSSKNVLRAL